MTMGGRPCTREHVPVFCMSLRTSAHTGVAIRVPAGKANKLAILWANPQHLSYSPKVFPFAMSCRRVTDCHVAPLLAMTMGGRPCTRRHAPAFRTPCAPNILAPAHTSFLLHVIANQCAHWCGNPFPRRNTWQVGNTLGEFVPTYEFALSAAILLCPAAGRSGLPRRFAPRNDNGGTSLHPPAHSRVPHTLRAKHPCTRAHVLSSACHCEPVRTLVWQSVLPAEKLGKLAILWANS